MSTVLFSDNFLSSPFQLQLVESFKNVLKQKQDLLLSPDLYVPSFTTTTKQLNPQASSEPKISKGQKMPSEELHVTEQRNDPVIANDTLGSLNATLTTASGNSSNQSVTSPRSIDSPSTTGVLNTEERIKSPTSSVPAFSPRPECLEQASSCDNNVVESVRGECSESESVSFSPHTQAVLCMKVRVMWVLILTVCIISLDSKPLRRGPGIDCLRMRRINSKIVSKLSVFCA